MPKATDNPTPSRRRALCDGAAAALDRPITPAIAEAGPKAGDDAELIRLCDRMVEIQARTFELYSGPCAPKDPDNDPVIGPELAALSADWLEVMLCLVGLAPVTLPGARALARAALANAERDINWKIVTGDPAPSLMHQAVGWLAGDFAAWLDTPDAWRDLASPPAAP